ncbi:putative GATA transcription factor 22 isoform X1 [Carya illinoinensis]|uniref:putative GATA transcription factor 22 isoform X1 n=1 Tax=Carya illinoinensis TaxID=32201 RepID=UPI001C7188A7|nr:putative GATA transcription factor 22 isoform X1 [Carya illinoinensis]
MTPAYLNPPSSPCPLVYQREDDHQRDIKLSISTHIIQASSSLSTSSCPTFFDRAKDEIGSIFEDQSQEHDEKKSVEEDGNINPHKLSSCQREEYGDPSKNTAHGGPVQYSCMSSKMRWMQKMMDPNCPATNNKPVRSIIKKSQNNLQNGDSDQLSSPNCSSNSTSNARVCADCNTTTTPLWRGGPRGPKDPACLLMQSLCNACGIRQRKARRAMAEAAAAAAAANGMGVAPDISKKKKKISKLHKKENKSGTKNLLAAHEYKKYCKLKCPSHSEMMSERKQLSFKDLALNLRNSSALGRVFPQDEAEAAILLMELSCGALVHS